MLLTIHAYIAWVAGEAGRPNRQVTSEEARLNAALSEIIPAALCTDWLYIPTDGIDLHIFYPFRPFVRHDYKIVIEDYGSLEPTIELEKRAYNIKKYLRKLIPDKTFDVRIRPGQFARSADFADPTSDNDMSMEAAYDRALDRMKRTT